MSNDPLSNNEDMFNEAAGFIASNYPRALRLFYDRCTSEGFTPDQSMTLVARYFEMLLANAIRDDEEEIDVEECDSDSDSGSDFDYRS